MNAITRRAALQLGIAASSVCLLGSTQAQAQILPESARILVGFPPGGGIDLISRRLAEQLTGKLAKSVIVDNRPGAAGRIAVDIALQSPPDGLTLLLNPAGVLTINPHTFKKSNYDPFKDFTALSLVAWIDFGFAVGPGVPAEVKTLTDFAIWAKANNGRVTYGSPAAGAPPHFVGDLVSRKLGLNMTHVPYRGGTPALNDLMGGQISAVVLTLGDLVQPAKAGKLRLLASTGSVRSKFAPDTPTFAEQNVTGLDVRDWFGVYIAGAASDGVKARVLPMIRTALASKTYADGVAILGIEAASSTPKEMEQLFRTDYVRWGGIVRASGFSADV
jgi:tripartite-type tricarboxylate transporter receptor subunit TctC